MLILISPAKTLDFQSEVHTSLSSKPIFEDKADQIVAVLKKYNPGKLSEIMSVSDSLASLNYDRFQSWNSHETPARQALLAFKGDVYIGLDAQSMTDEDLIFAQKHLRILSGLYGVLQPMDLIKPYRLEMGTSLSVKKTTNLYDFWKQHISKSIQMELKSLKSNLIINLASNEYSKSVDFKALKVDLVSPEFKDYKNGDYKIISFFAKKARGLMSSFIIRNRISNADDIVAFAEEGYVFNNELSKPGKPVFTRG
ncbi:MAG: peroxide stress protein YaaA [Bacteroidetes bacterium]|jgi:uncharacterized protein|nr:peroxide stress protein YaaA [Bacteroidota bacterium]